MKTTALILLAGMAVIASSSALAFRDESQSVQISRVMEAKKAEQRAQPKEKQTGVAGPTGVAGRIGPATQTNRSRKDPTAHP